MTSCPRGRTNVACPDESCRHVGCWLVPEQLSAQFDFDILEPPVDLWTRATVIEHEGE